jgi:RNA polymerase sigma factor (sigma-70 family)
MRYDPLPPNDGDERQSDSLNDSAAETTDSRGAPPLPPRLAEFRQVYRAEFGAVVAYFARRYEDPQLVADLTADTFVAAIRAFPAYDAAATGSRAWAIGLARGVDTAYRESDPRGEDPVRRASIEGLLDRAEKRELTWWIDLERSSRELIAMLERMSRLDREAVELVDLCGLTGAEAAAELGISSAALRVRLLRSRTRLKREGGGGV